MRHSIAIAATVAAFGTFAVAEAISPTEVAFGDYGAVSEPLTEVAGDAEAGLEIYESRGLGNCVACHQISSSEAAFQGTVGPMLDGVGSRWSVEELRGIVINAKIVFPDSVMPSFYRTEGYIRPGDAFTGKAAEGPLEPLLNAQQVEDVVAFLTTLTD